MNAKQLMNQSQQWLLDDHVESNLSNLVALWFDQLDQVNWLGIYWLKDNQLLVGPFQGKPACSPLSLDHGVCAGAIINKQPLVVADVHQFNGHIACDSASASEMVTLLKNGETILGVLDIDSPVINHFDASLQQTIHALTQMVNDYLTCQNYHPLIR